MRMRNTFQTLVFPKKCLNQIKHIHFLILMTRNRNWNICVLNVMRFSKVNLNWTGILEKLIRIRSQKFANFTNVHNVLDCFKHKNTSNNILPKFMVNIWLWKNEIVKNLNSIFLSMILDFILNSKYAMKKSTEN